VPEPDPLERTELTLLFGLAFQLLQTAFVREMDAAGYTDLRPVHGMVFQILRHGGATSTELADRLGVTKQAAGQIVQYLEDHGYVARHHHPDGGRRRLVVLTAKADTHLALAGQHLARLESQLVDRVGDRDLATVRRTVARMIRELAGHDLPPLRPNW
jgi:DNA-binding MarR family transcriptional regulator